MHEMGSVKVVDLQVLNQKTYIEKIEEVKKYAKNPNPELNGLKVSAEK